MTEPVTTQRPSIDFEEFERAMRDPSRTRQQEDDPLAELARLVGAPHDPYGEVFAREADAPRPSTNSASGVLRPALDFASIEAGLRGSIPAHDAAPRHQSAPRPAYGGPDHEFYVPPGADAHDQPDHARDQGGWYDPAEAAAPPSASRSRRPIYAMAAVILVGVVGIGVAFAYKGSNSGPREIAMIKAAPGPTKIQPPADSTADDSQTRDASILDKGQQTTPTKLASHEEQPVDLAQTVMNAPRDVGNGLMPIYNISGSTGDAASVPAPSPAQARGDAGSAKADPLAIASDIEPIRVKTRSYRPDGTPILNDQPPVAAIADAAPNATPKAEKSSVAKPATPKTATPKSTSRVATTPKPIVTADRSLDTPSADTPAASAPTPRKAKPVKTPVKIAEAAPEPTDDAGAAQPEAAAPASGGGFAVQLAAPASEAEAKQASTRFSQKFASELSGHRLSFHKASSLGKTVYRVRVGSLTREEATDMCEKLKADGGSCFVAKNN